MKEFHIPTAAYEVFDDPAKALCYIEEKNEYPVVIKADGLALGKGVIIAASHEEAKEGLHEIMEEKVFGTSGNHVVVEEFLTAPEVSVLAFVDGKTVGADGCPRWRSKRALDGDKGLNTGGMGTIAPNPFYTPEVAQECMEKIFKPTVAAMASLGRPFKGCLYFGLMLTPKGPYLIEYNSRFGDPETQVVLELLDSDLVEIMEAVYNGTLTEEMVKIPMRRLPVSSLQAAAIRNPTARVCQSVDWIRVRGKASAFITRVPNSPTAYTTTTAVVCWA